MPGIAACIRLSGTRPIPSPDALTRSLTCEPDYQTHPVEAGPDIQAVAFAPRLSFPVAGAATDPASGIAAAYYGEFFGPGFAGLDAAATALRLIELYRQLGTELPGSLNGSFVAFVWNAQAGEGIAFTDHYASRPICYTEQNGLLYLSPEPKGIAHLPDVSARCNETALVMMLNFGHLLGDATYYEQIRYLPPGSILHINRGAVRLTRYFEYRVNETSAGADSRELSEQLAVLLRQAIRKRIHHLKDFVIPISGGYDSRGILAIVTELTGAHPKTVSWGTDEQTEGADAWVGRRVSDYCGGEHQFLPRKFEDSVDDMEEMLARVDHGVADAMAHACELRLMREIRHQLGRDYLLRGDENFGYTAEAHSASEALARVGVRPLEDFPDVVGLLHPGRRTELVRMAHAALEEADAACPLSQPNARKDFHYYYLRTRNNLNLLNYYKLTVLEATNPWMDRDVMEFVSRLPATCRIDKELYRQTLISMFPELMQKVPMARTHSLEQQALLMRQTPRLQKFLRFHLLERRNRLDQIVDGQGLRDLVTGILEGRNTQSAKVGFYMKAKDTLRSVSPALYQLVRSKARAHGVISALPPDTVIYRLLAMKLICDQLP